jgi:hypothetical protein
LGGHQWTLLLVGYPGITLYDAAGAAMPFHYTHGHSQYVTWAPPMTVTLRPRTSAYLLVAKYRCDVGIVRDAATRVDYKAAGKRRRGVIILA